MMHRNRYIPIGVTTTIVVALTFMIYKSWDENKRLVRAREVGHSVRTYLEYIEWQMQQGSPDDTVLTHSAGGESTGDQLNWTTRWDTSEIQVNWDDPKASTKHEIVNLRIHWLSHGEQAVIEWGAAPRSREAAEMLDFLLEGAAIRASIERAPG